MSGVNKLLELFVDNSELDLVGLEAVINISGNLLETIRHVLKRVKLLHFQDSIVTSAQDNAKEFQLFNVLRGETIRIFFVDQGYDTSGNCRERVWAGV